MVLRGNRERLRAEVRRVPVLDRAVRSLRHTDEILALNVRVHELEVLLATEVPAILTAPLGPDRLGSLYFRCNICRSDNAIIADLLRREEPSCHVCGSTVRLRGVIHALSTALFDQSLSIPDFPRRPDIIGWGMTDWEGYALPLAETFRYTNTFYHAEPHLDITSISSSDIGTLDFLIASDVFEHVLVPVKIAFENARRLLKDNGVFVLTVPYGLQPATIEHFPNLNDFTIEGEGSARQLINVTVDGERETFSDLVFHGGAGSTLEMRVFSRDSLLADLQAAGFSRVEILSEPCFEHGVYWREPWSLPIVARP